MSQTGYTPISLYYSSTASAVPTAGNLVPGELAINTADGRLYYKDSAGVVQVIGTKGGVGSSTNTQILYNSSGLVVGSSNMIFDGTNFQTVNILPTSSGTKTLGSTSLKWSSVYASELADGTDQLIGTIGTTFRVGAGSSWTAQAFYTGGSERMRIDSSGNVGIGMTPASTVILDVKEPDAGQDGIFRVFPGTGNGIQIRAIAQADSTTSAMSFYTVAGSSATERMRIDSSGNVGIGTTSPASKLDVTGKLTVSTSFAGDVIANIVNSSATGYGLRVVGGASGSGYIASFNDYTGANKVYIDGAGNVGIGTTSPYAKLDIVQTTAGYGGWKYGLGVNATDFPALRFLATTGNTGNIIAHEAGSLVFLSGTTATAAGTERMRIDSSGNLLVGQTSTINSEKLGVTANGNAFLVKNTANGGTARLVYMNSNGTIDYFYNYATSVNTGTITATATSVAYNTSSDYRLKENIAPMTGALDVVQQLKPVTYNWKADGSAGQGFIAHELQAVVPDCVTGEKDAVDEDGNPVYQGIDTSFLVATLTAAIQEQQVMINELKAKVAALEAA